MNKKEIEEKVNKLEEELKSYKNNTRAILLREEDIKEG